MAGPICLVFAFVLFVLAIPLSGWRYSLIAAGLAFLVASQLFGGK